MFYVVIKIIVIIIDKIKFASKSFETKCVVSVATTTGLLVFVFLI